jgi:hypothetical protein
VPRNKTNSNIPTLEETPRLEVKLQSKLDHNGVNNSFQYYSAFRRYFAKKTGSGSTILPSAGHAMPDAEECPVMGGAEKMTCDYSYTAETKRFFEDYADLNLAP